MIFVNHVQSALLLHIKYLPHNLKCFWGAEQGSAVQKWQESVLPDVSHHWTPALVSLFTFQAQDTLSPTTELPADALIEREMRNLTEKGGLSGFVLRFRGLSSFPVQICCDTAQPSLTLGEILAFLKSRKCSHWLHWSQDFHHVCVSMFFQVRKHGKAGDYANLCSHVVNFCTKPEKSVWTKLTDPSWQLSGQHGLPLQIFT